MAVASLVLGIIALVISIFSGGSLGVVGIICGVLGLIFGIVGRKDEAKKGLPQQVSSAHSSAFCSD